MRRSQSLTHFELSLRDGAIAVREMRRRFRRAETSASLRPTIYGSDAPRLIAPFDSDLRSIPSCFADRRLAISPWK